MGRTTTEEMVRVRVRGTMNVRYDQTVTMTKKEYAKFEELYEAAQDDLSAEGRLAEEVQEVLNLHDIDDGDTLEDVEIDLVPSSPGETRKGGSR